MARPMARISLGVFATKASKVAVPAPRFRPDPLVSWLASEMNDQLAADFSVLGPVA